MQRLSGLDASFLYLETESQPMHVCSIMDLDTSTMPGGYAFDRLRDALSVRIKAMPEFREKLANSPLNLDHPVWVDDEGFDVDRHLHRIGLPPPGGRAELSEICGHIASLPLDRRRPRLPARKVPLCRGKRCSEVTWPGRRRQSATAGVVES